MELIEKIDREKGESPYSLKIRKLMIDPSAAHQQKKLRGDETEHVSEEDTLQYSTIDFALVFSTPSSIVRCSNIIKNENKDQLFIDNQQFKQGPKFVLGFKIVVEC